MADPEKKKRMEDFLKAQEDFRTNALSLIITMLDWCNKTPGSKHLVDEMLHGIFFLGKINPVHFLPEEIITDKEMFDALKDKYPRPFDFYKSQLPRRSPFSCVLDMIVQQKKPENDKQIKQSLQELIRSLKPKFLFSSTICISQKSKNDSVKYYGVCMSTNGTQARLIVIAASCFSAWDDYVARAVMTYYPGKKKRTNFDATMKLPKEVRCEAFGIRNGETMHPCRSCANLFGLITPEAKEWAYGNCAEAESVSNLLRNEREVKSRTQVQPYTEDNLKKAKESVMNTLRNTLKQVKFRTWDETYYNAQ